VDDKRHMWVIGLLSIAALFLVGAATEWFTVALMTTAHWIVFWSLVLAASTCLAVAIGVFTRQWWKRHDPLLSWRIRRHPMPPQGGPVEIPVILVPTGPPGEEELAPYRRALGLLTHSESGKAQAAQGHVSEEWFEKSLELLDGKDFTLIQQLGESSALVMAVDMFEFFANSSDVELPLRDRVPLLRRLFSEGQELDRRLPKLREHLKESGADRDSQRWASDVEAVLPKQWRHRFWEESWLGQRGAVNVNGTLGWLEGVLPDIDAEAQRQRDAEAQD
jgi:hypothetical protein